MPQYLRPQKESFSDKLIRKAEEMEKRTVFDYNLAEEITTKPSKTVHKRKLLDDAWDWAPYSKNKTPRKEGPFESSGYLSDTFDDSILDDSTWNDSQVVPNWEDVKLGIVCEYDDIPRSKSAVTIDENSVIEEEAQSVIFDMEEWCDIGPPEDGHEVGLTLDGHGNALHMLLPYANNPQILLYGDNQPDKQVESLSDLYDVNESSPVVTNELEDDCQMELLKLARCFKCRQKVYIMKDCPSHTKKEALVKNK